MLREQCGVLTKSQMNILIISQYFWPEDFRINAIVEDMLERGHNVIVLTGLPNYPDGKVFRQFLDSPQKYNSYHGAKVIRVPHLARGNKKLSLVANYVTFFVSASLLGYFKLIGQKIDVCFVYEPSPLTVGIPGILIGKFLKKAPVVFWVLDLWPETLHALGFKNKIISILVKELAGWIYRNCEIVLGQSNSFIGNITENYQKVGRIEYFPSFSEEDMDPKNANLAPEIQYAPHLLNIVFTGNIGLAQDFENVVLAAKILKDDPVRWIIVGEGRDLNRILMMIDDLNLKDKFLFPGRFPIKRMTSFMAHADCLLVCLKKDPVFALTIPAKIQAYLTSGLPILGMLDGDGADVIVESKAGIVSDAGDFEGLVQNVRQMIETPESTRRQMGQNAKTYAYKHFNKKRLLDKLNSWFLDIVDL